MSGDSAMNGRVCLVTAAASGIGEAIARRLAAAGGVVVGVDLRRDGAADVSDCASKGAVIALTRALAVDQFGDGVRVNCVCPGTVDSPWVRRIVEDAGRASTNCGLASRSAGSARRRNRRGDALLASPASSFVTGSALVIDRGLTAA